MRRDRLDADGAEQERQDEGSGREPVVDDDPEPTLPNRLYIEGLEQILCVPLTHAGRIRNRADLSVRHAPELLTREVLLDLLLQRRRDLDARLLEEADLHHLGIGRARTDVETGVVAVRLQQVS